MSDSQDPLSIKALKRRARRLRRASGITHSQALNRVANQAGYQGFKNAQNVLAAPTLPAAALPASSSQAGALDLSGLATAIAVTDPARTRPREDHRERRVRSVLARAQASLFMSMGLRDRRQFDTRFAELFIADFDVLDDPRIKARARAIWAQVSNFNQAAYAFETMSAYEKTVSRALDAAVDLDRRAQEALVVEAAFSRHEAELGALAQSKAELATVAAYETARRYEVDLARLARPTSTFERALEDAMRAQALTQAAVRLTATEQLASEVRRAEALYRIAERGF